MHQAFELTVKDADGQVSVLDGYKEYDIDIGTTHVFIGDLRMFVMPSLGEAKVDDLEFKKTGEPGNPDTHVRFQGALKWLVEAYPEIERVSVCDVAVCQASGAYLTQQRILAGQPGWYEAHYGATVGRQTRFSVAGVRRCLVKPRSLDELAYYSARMCHSEWGITRETIETYPVRVEGWIEKESDASDANKSPWESREEAYSSHWIKSIQAKYGQE